MSWHLQINLKSIITIILLFQVRWPAIIFCTRGIRNIWIRICNETAEQAESFRVGLRLWEYQHRLFLNVVMLGSLTARGQSRLQRKLCVTGRYLVRCSPPVRLWPSELFPRDCIGAEPSVITSSESRSRVNETYQRYSASWQIILMTNWPERLCLLSISHYSVSGEGQGLAPSHLSAEKCPEGGEQEMSWSWLWTSLHGLWLHSC